MAKDFTLKLENFTGLVISGDTPASLLPGDAAEMVNFRITEGKKLCRREGFSRVFSPPAALRGIYCGSVKGEKRYLAVCGSALYASREGFHSLSEVEGSLSGEGQVFFFPFHSELYLLTGERIYRYDGEKAEEIEPYIPLVMICTPPTGGGVVYEDVNLLTKKIRQRFSPDGKNVNFPAVSENIARIDWVKVDGVKLAEEDCWFDYAHASFEFLGAPEAGTDTIEIQYELAGEDVSDRIHRCRFASAFGGASDTRAFLYGNPDSPAVRYHSGIVDGKPSFTYFPETAFALVGTGEAITAVCRHYDRQLIFTESSAYYSYLEYMTGSEDRLIAGFPVLPLNGERGCIAPGQAILVENTPVTLAEGGIFQWISTNIRDERNAECLSDSIDQALRKENLEKGILFNRKETSELYLCIGENCYVYNYRLKLFYRHQFPVILGFCRDKELYFYTRDGIFVFGGNSDDGAEIYALWRSGFLDFSEGRKEKKLFGGTVIAKGGEKSELQISFRGENETEKVTKRICFSDRAEGERISFPAYKRRFGSLEISLETVGEEAVHVLSLFLKGRITDAE